MNTGMEYDFKSILQLMGVYVIPPFAIETAIFFVPFYFGFRQIGKPFGGMAYLLFAGLFVAEFFVSIFLLSVAASAVFIKMTISIVLFVLMFWKKLTA